MIARRRRVLALFFGALQLLVGSRVFATSTTEFAQAVPAASMHHDSSAQEHCPPPTDADHQHQDQGCHAGPVCCIPILPLVRVANAHALSTIVAIATEVRAASHDAPISRRAFALPPATAPPVA